MRRCCAVFSCANRSLKLGTISMYRFPADPALCEKWVEFCKSDQITETLVLQGVAKLRSSSFCVCSDHFEKRCFVNPKNTAQGIYKGSIPTIIAGHPVLVSSYKKANRIPEYHVLDPNQHDESEKSDDNLTVEVLEEDAKEPDSAEETVEQPPPQPVISGIVHPSIFDCECQQKSEYEPKFYAERSRAVGLVQELDATKEKLRKIKKPQRHKKAALQRVNESIAKLKRKMQSFASEHHLKVNLELSDDEVDDEFVFDEVTVE